MWRSSPKGLCGDRRVALYSTYGFNGAIATSWPCNAITMSDGNVWSDEMRVGLSPQMRRESSRERNNALGALTVRGGSIRALHARQNQPAMVDYADECHTASE